MRRGEIWWAELPPPVKPRPVVVLTRNAAVNSIDSVVVALVTRTSRSLGSEVEIGRGEGLRHSSVISLDNILTVPKHRMTQLIGALRNEKLAELNDAICFALDIP